MVLVKLDVVYFKQVFIRFIFVELNRVRLSHLLKVFEFNFEAFKLLTFFIAPFITTQKEYF